MINQRVQKSNDNQKGREEIPKPKKQFFSCHRGVRMSGSIRPRRAESRKRLLTELPSEDRRETFGHADKRQKE